MVTAANLRQLLNVMDVRLALLGPHEPDEDAEKTEQRAETQAKRADYARQLAELTTDNRLPYKDSEA